MLIRLVPIVLLLPASLLRPSVAEATYSPPLTRVRIDASLVHHTPSILYASETRTTASTDLNFTAWGAQYVGQFEWDFGFGVQVTAAAGRASIGGSLDLDVLRGASIAAGGWWGGGALRVYQMLLATSPSDGSRPSALTAFVNVRGLYYVATDANRAAIVDLEAFTLTGGVGAIAELSIHDYVSLCPYAWFTPGFAGALDYRASAQRINQRTGLSARTPLQFGLDVWVYPFSRNWQDHVSLSFLASLIDTEDRGNKTLSFVLGYTF